jgi:hypothetical protein
VGLRVLGFFIMIFFGVTHPLASTRDQGNIRLLVLDLLISWCLIKLSQGKWCASTSCCQCDIHLRLHLPTVHDGLPVPSSSASFCVFCKCLWSLNKCKSIVLIVLVQYYYNSMNKSRASVLAICRGPSWIFLVGRTHIFSCNGTYTASKSSLFSSRTANLVLTIASLSALPCLTCRAGLAGWGGDSGIGATVSCSATRRQSVAREFACRWAGASSSSRATRYS